MPIHRHVSFSNYPKKSMKTLTYIIVQKIIWIYFERSFTCCFHQTQLRHSDDICDDLVETNGSKDEKRDI